MIFATVLHHTQRRDVYGTGGDSKVRLVALGRQWDEHVACFGEKGERKRAL